MTHRPTPLVRTVLGLALLLSLLPGQAAAAGNDFPTVDRVLYVQECMRNHPGPHYEMVNKCACAQDKLAAEVPFDDYVSMSTAANATTIGGERGAYIRDAESLQALIKRYREIQTRVKKACFINLP
jgi:hypothetical protein